MLRKPRVRKGDVVDQRWDSLSTLKKYFDSNKLETVKDFDGFSLTTNKHTYTLFDG